MKYFTANVQEKNELEKKGHKCFGGHNIYENGKPTGALQWEFDLPKDLIIKPQENKIGDKPMLKSASLSSGSKKKINISTLKKSIPKKSKR